jgi:uncharacterized protein
MTTGRFVAVALLAVLALPALADDQRLPLWQINGDSNRIYLLGSVHLLRPSDYPLPAAIYDAYEDAETLIMELDMDDLDPLAAQALATELGVLSGGGSLAALLGAENYAIALALAEKAAIPLELLAQTEPWLAAITVEQLMLTRIGFNPEYGVENHLTQRATADQKEILGLESMNDQLQMLDGLPMAVQQALLLQTLEEGLEIETLMNELIAAWRSGDIETLERTMLKDMQQHPELYQQLVVERNRNWVGQIVALLDEPEDYLVVVGALHLIGDDGVPRMLDKLGHSAKQLVAPGPAQ